MTHLFIDIQSIVSFIREIVVILFSMRQSFPSPRDRCADITLQHDVLPVDEKPGLTLLLFLFGGNSYIFLMHELLPECWLVLVLLLMLFLLILLLLILLSTRFPFHLLILSHLPTKVHNQRHARRTRRRWTRIIHRAL
jgi:hypothetical protein